MMMKRKTIDWENVEDTIEYTPDVEAYARLPYHFDMYYDDEDGWVVTLPEFPGMIAIGDTPNEAIALAEDAKRGWIAISRRANLPIPAPRSVGKPTKRNGIFTVRMSAPLHEMAAAEAKSNDLSLNEMVVQMMAFVVAQGFDSVIRQAAENRLRLAVGVLANVYTYSNRDLGIYPHVSMGDVITITDVKTTEYDFGSEDELARKRKLSAELSDDNGEGRETRQYGVIQNG